MSLTRMSSRSLGLSFSLGCTSLGRDDRLGHKVHKVDQDRQNICHRERISIAQICIYLVSSLAWFFSQVGILMNLGVRVVMSIVTYILIAAFHAGINSRFNPAVRLSPFIASNSHFLISPSTN